MEISREQELEWHRRIAGVPPLVPLGDVHAQLDSVVTRLTGTRGLTALSLNGLAESDDSRGFSALRVRTSVGSVNISRLLVTPVRIEWPGDTFFGGGPSRERLLRDGRLSVYVRYGGITRVWVGDSHVTFRPGSARYVSSGFPHVTAHSGLSDILAVEVPVSRISDLVGNLLAQPIERFPDNDINLGMMAFAGRFLFRSLVGPKQQHANESDQEEAIVSVVRSALGPLFRGKRADSSAEISRLIDHEIELNHRDPGLSVDSLAEAAGLSRRQLYRYTTVGLADRLGRRRAETARATIESDPDLKLGLVAGISGFSDANRMRHHFVKAFGILPSDYQAEVRRRTAEDLT